MDTNEMYRHIPKYLRPKVEHMYHTKEGWSIQLRPGYFSRRCYGRSIWAKTKKEALHLLEMAIPETFYEEDAEGRTIAEELTVDEAKRKYPDLPEGHTLKSALTGVSARYAIPDLFDWGGVEI